MLSFWNLYIFGYFDLSNTGVTNYVNNVCAANEVSGPCCAGSLSLLTGTPKWSRATVNGISYTRMTSQNAVKKVYAL